MLLSIISILLLVIFVEAITEIITTSEFFLGFRNYFAKRNPDGFITKLISCGYCTSVWVSATVAWVPVGVAHHIDVLLPLAADVVDYFIILFILHRLSNLFHDFVSRYKKGLPLFGPYIEVEDDEEAEG